MLLSEVMLPSSMIWIDKTILLKNVGKLLQYTVSFVTK